MKSHFSQSGQIFSQFWVFEAIFEARGKNLRIFKNSVCTFFCTQNNRLDLTVLTQKMFFKKEPPQAYIFAKINLNMARQTKPPANNSISQIYQPRVGHFSNLFLLTDEDGLFEYNEMVQTENQNCKKARPYLAKVLFI